MAVTSIANKLKRGSLLVGNSAYMPPSFESIQTVTLSSNASSITFSSIPSTYTHLQIRYTAKNVSGGITDMYMSMNGDSGLNYSKHWLFTFDGGGPYTSTSTSSGNFSIGYLKGDESGVMNAGIIDILDYTNGNKYKTVRYLDGSDKVSIGTTTVVLGSGMWMSGSAISSITLSCGTILSGGQFALYGIKG
jgi:hypothetical protein